ncbi:MAG: DNA polymerase IV [Lentisphaeria bacterium]|nr:DNA polymerase IV [Candidatus Neomarinimicrobiota bacterium]MCF7841575.1 DNA polymerase IV [Lentisphaeria bacterium]
METPRAIVHFDLDAFYCSVELLRHPELKEKPLVVGGRAEQRGVVAAASYKAREYGIHSAMSMYRAQQLCRELVILPMQRNHYQMYSRIIMGILQSAAPKIEPVSIDEAYLDFTPTVHEWHDVLERVKDIQLRIRRDLGLPNSVGIATNKMVAKIASDFNKPNGFTVVEPGRETEFLAPLAVSKIPGIGPKMTQRLQTLGIERVKDLAQVPVEDLTQQFGKWGRGMAEWARGIDNRPVESVREAKSMSQERTFSRDVHDPEELDAWLDRMSTELGTQLRKEGLMAFTIQIKIRYPDFTTFTRQMTLGSATAEPAMIRHSARILLGRIWEPGTPVRLLGVGCRNFTNGVGQLNLPGLQ